MLLLRQDASSNIVAIAWPTREREKLLGHKEKKKGRLEEGRGWEEGGEGLQQQDRPYVVS